MNTSLCKPTTAASGPDRTRPLAIATLGPTGTSSEVAARFLGDRLRRGSDEPFVIRLCRTYEQAAELTAGHEADMFIVANAYAGISVFYMNPKLRLVAAFVMDTPPYGLAARPRDQRLGKVRVATHPAPEPLITELLPADLCVDTVIRVNSTSAAAAAVESGTADVALTTVPAASATGLLFLSKTRCITMVWSAFARRTAEP